MPILHSAPDDRWLCIYHARCLDGFGAAWAVHDHFVRHQRRHQITFHAGMFQKPAPEAQDRRVLIVDFSYPRAVMKTLCASAREVIVIDHHISAERDLAGLEQECPNLHLHFDQTHSGALLAWRCCNGDAAPPALLQRIEDRDLWRFAYPDTKAVNLALFDKPFSFEAWDTLMAGGDKALAALAEEGRILHGKFERDVERLVKSGVHRLQIAGHDVPALNVPPLFASAAGERMSQNEPFAATYHHTDGKTIFSLRSQPEGLDVAEIAARFGGGGHARAAGFSIRYQPAPVVPDPTPPSSYPP